MSNDERYNTYMQYLTEEQNIAIDRIFPHWSMERDNDGNIVIYPNLQDEDDEPGHRCGEEVYGP